MNLDFIKIGNPPAVTCDYTTSNVVTYCRESSTPLFEQWHDALDKRLKYQLFLSGGIDSQFSFHVLKTLGLKFSIVVCDMRWDNITVNSHDLLTAQRFAESNNIKYRTVVLDLKEFLNSEEYIELGLKYRTSSPQIAVHTKILELGNDNESVNVLGGDVPVLQYSNRNKTASPSSYFSKIFFVQSLFAYYNFGFLNDVPVIKDLFMLSDRIMYQAVKQNAEVIKQHNVYFDGDNPTKSSNFVYKMRYYNTLGATIMNPLIKSTGFETVKKMLAEESGVYNQFDQLYRYPMQNAFFGSDWGNEISAKKPGDRQMGKLSSLVNDFKILIEEVQPKECNLYRLDL